MKKVLIVDDEENIREGIQHLIDWKEQRFEIVATAKNGQEGLKKIIKYHPDLVITDIQMPLLNGLDMIKQAYEMNQEFQAIVLSGYSEFEYAQKAIQLGFISYLLKPVDEEELIEILQKVKQKSQKQSKIVLKEKLYEKLFGDDQYGMDEYQYILVCRIQKSDETNLIFMLEKWTDQLVVLHFDNYVYLIVLMNSLIYKLDIEEFLSKQKSEILVSSWYAASKSLQEISNEINQLSYKAFLFPNQPLFFDEFYNKSNDISFHEEVVSDIIESLKKNESLSKLPMEYMKEIQKIIEPSRVIREIIEKDYRKIISTISENFQITELSQSILKPNFYDAKTFNELMNIFISKLTEFEQLVYHNGHNFDIVKKLCQYIEKNYYEEINLKIMADKFGYNSAYLGKKFKKERKESFTQYLDRIRLKKAADLLKNSSLLIYEVADKVGYKNVDYFHKKFKQLYKQSPNDYRRQTTKN